MFTTLKESSGLPAADFSALVGVSKHPPYAWRKRFKELGPAGLEDQPRGGPRGSHLPDITKRAILMMKDEHPDWGTQRITLAGFSDEELERIEPSFALGVLWRRGGGTEREDQRALPGSRRPRCPARIQRAGRTPRRPGVDRTSDVIPSVPTPSELPARVRLRGRRLHPVFPPYVVGTSFRFASRSRWRARLSSCRFDFPFITITSQRCVSRSRSAIVISLEWKTSTHRPKIKFDFRQLRLPLRPLVALPLIARDELEILATAVERPLVSEMDSLVRPCVDDGALKVEREVLAVLLHGSAGVAESRAWRLQECFDAHSNTSSSTRAYAPWVRWRVFDIL